jgi:YD repeat-containing protein
VIHSSSHSIIHPGKTPKICLLAILILFVLSQPAFAQQSDTIKYEYDRLNRLIKVTYLSSGASIIYTYDAAGNRTAVQVQGNNLAPVLTSSNPASVPAGTHGFTLGISGNNLVNGASVLINDSPRTTTYFGRSVTIELTDADLSSPRELNINVVNPDGAKSNTIVFNVTQSTGFSISGRVATVSNGNLAGVTLILSGTQGASIQSDSSGNYAFGNLPAGNYTVTPSKTAFSFNPANESFLNLSSNQVANFTASLIPQVPILVSEETNTRAIALDSVMQLREPFQATPPVTWGADGRTRVTLFAMNFSLNAGENISILAVDAEDASHCFYPLSVEAVSLVPNQPWLTAITVRLHDDMRDLGDVLIRVTARGVFSNRVRLAIGRIGGGPTDDSGAVPTPGRQPN